MLFALTGLCSLFAILKILVNVRSKHTAAPERRFKSSRCKPSSTQSEPIDSANNERKRTERKIYYSLKNIIVSRCCFLFDETRF